jgi:hypothetical protein
MYQLYCRPVLSAKKIACDADFVNIRSCWNISEYIVSKARVTEFDLPWSNSPASQQNHVTLKFCNELCRMRRSLIGPEVSDRKFSVLQEIGLVMWSISVGRCWRINQWCYCPVNRLPAAPYYGLATASTSRKDSDPLVNFSMWRLWSRKQ